MCDDLGFECLKWQRIAAVISAQILEINARNEQANRENVEVLKEILAELRKLNGKDEQK